MTRPSLGPCLIAPIHPSSQGAMFVRLLPRSVRKRERERERGETRLHLALAHQHAVPGADPIHAELAEGQLVGSHAALLGAPLMLLRLAIVHGQGDHGWHAAWHLCPYVIQYYW